MAFHKKFDLKNLLNISFFPVTACVTFLRAKLSHAWIPNNVKAM